VEDQHGASDGLAHELRQDVGEFDQGAHGSKMEMGCDNWTGGRSDSGTDRQ
jgi:hypothetical protein